MKNLLGVHALVWAGDWTPAAARRSIESTRQAGFDLIEIPLLDPATVDPVGTRSILQGEGLQAACSLGLSPTTDVTSEDPRVVAAGRDHLARALDVAAGLGATHFCGVLYSNLGKYPTPLSPLGREHATDSMRWLAEQARQRELPVSLEVVNRYETNVANTAADMLQFIADAGGDLGVHLDTYHMNIEEDGFAEPIVTAGEQLRYVHVGESHRGYLGTGTINFEQFFTALRSAEYSGPITFESFSSAVVHPELSNTLAVWRNLWSDSADLAKSAHDFIVTGMAER